MKFKIKKIIAFKTDIPTVDYPQQIKTNHKGLMLLKKLPELQREYNSEQLPGWEVKIIYKLYN